MNNSNERKTLGKGLSALISEASTSFMDDQKPESGVCVLQLRDITFNPNQPRKIITHEELEELSSSIKEYGVLQPIIVRKIDDGYQIIAGERRYHAAKQAGLVEIPVIIKKTNEIDSFEIAMIENIQRQNLNSLEEAEAFRKLIDEYGHTQESLAQKMGKSRSYISNTMRLLKLPQEIKQMIADGRVSAGHARAIINSDNPLELARYILENNLSVREAENIMKRLQTKESKDNSVAFVENQKQKSEQDADLLQMERAFARILSADVRIRQEKNDYCSLVIRCRGLEALDTILSKLNDGGLDL